jgi:hypothetical protein
MPASSRPRRSRPDCVTASAELSSLPRPESRISEVNSAPSTPVSTRLASVPATATEVCTLTPWVRYSAANMIAEAPTTAINSGGEPSRIAGTTKNSSSPKLTARPASDVTPRRRPNARITPTASRTSQIIGVERWRSTTEYARPPGTASGK